MRLLVVDDEVRLAESIARALRAEQFDVDVVHDGNDAMWQAEEVDYDAIILDIMLRGKNGYAVCRDLRAAGNSTPILMLTAKEGEWDEAEALDTGADDYLRKPFSLVVLLARLRALLRRGPQLTGDTISVGDLEIDPGQMTCQRGSDEPVTLTPREFAVLEHLARRAPDVVPKASLLDAVWGIDFEGDPATLIAPADSSRSSGLDSMTSAAASRMRCRRSPPACRVALPAVTSARLAMVPTP